MTKVNTKNFEIVSDIEWTSDMYEWWRERKAFSSGQEINGNKDWHVWLKNNWLWWMKQSFHISWDEIKELYMFLWAVLWWSEDVYMKWYSKWREEWINHILSEI